MGWLFCKNAERGNIATVLFGSVAMVGVISAATMQMISGPIKTASQVNNKNMVESQLVVGARILVLDNNATDVDADGTIEPVEHNGVNIGLTGGGGIPNGVGASKTDPWNSPYGYCVWDNGIDSTAAGNRLNGENSTDALAIALISAGANRTFETTCTAGPGGAVNKPTGSDDFVYSYTYAEAVSVAGGLWQTGTSNPNNEVVVKDSGGTETVTVDKEQGIGTFLGLVTALLTGNGGAGDNELEIDAPGGVGIGTESPDNKLHLNSSDGSAVNIQFTNSDTGEASSTDGFRIGLCSDENGCIAGNVAGKGLNFYTENTLKMTLDSDGNVGIGETNPAAKMEIQGMLGNASQIWDPYGTGTGGAEPTMVLFATNGAAAPGPRISFLTYNSAWEVYDQDAGASRLFIADNGDIGIGTNTPDAPLQFANNISETETANKIRLYESGTSSTYGIGISSGDFDFFSDINYRFHTSSDNTTRGTEVFTILENGNVGIGDPSPTANLEIQRNGGGMALWLDQDSAADLYMRYHVPGVTWWTVGPKADGDYWFSNTSNLTGTPPMELKTNGDLAIQGTLTADGISLNNGTAFNPAANVNAALVPSGSFGGGLVFDDAGYAGIWTSNNGDTLNFDVSGTSGGFSGGGYTGAMNLEQTLLKFDNKEAIQFNDTWLRLNQSGHFSNGVYTPGNLRVDGGLYLGSGKYITQKTGSYGTIQAMGASTWEGFSVRGTSVFMSNGSATGLYNDTDNEWLMYAVHNGATDLRYDGVVRAYTTSSGLEVNSTLSFASDKRLKENIKTVPNALERITKVNGVTYDWKDKETRGQGTQYGVIAQEIQDVFPDLVLKQDHSDYLTVNYTGLIAPLIEAVKELKSQNNDLMKRIEDLETK